MLKAAVAPSKPLQSRSGMFNYLNVSYCFCILQFLITAIIKLEILQFVLLGTSQALEFMSLGQSPTLGFALNTKKKGNGLL